MAVEPRVLPLDADVAVAAARDAGVPEYVASVNVFATLLRHPPLAAGLNALLGPLLVHPTIDARLRELVIMRVAWVTGSVYEWSQHWKLGQVFGVDPDDLAGVRDWESNSRYSATDRAVLTATDETLAGHALSDALWDELTAVLPAEAARMEVLMLIGGYQMLSGVLRSLRVPLDDGLEPWPPDGYAPG